LLIQGFKVKRGERVILEDFGIEVVRGVNLVIGPNGSGKTTLLRSIVGALGNLRSRVPESKGYVPSEFFSPEMKVVDVLLSGSRRNLEEYYRFAELLGVQHMLDRTFSTLSTGEKKLVLIVKALSEGDLVIMDEPMSGLDVRNQKRVLDSLTELKDLKTFMISTHELYMVSRSDWVIVMKAGRTIYQGEPRNLHERVLEETYGTKIKRVDLGDRWTFIPDL